jgi:hypothetical protein
MHLGLCEEIVLLGLDDESGKSVCYHMAYALSGAILADLILRGRLAVEDGQVRIAGGESTGDDVLDEALVAIAGSRKTKLSHWVRKIMADHQRDRVVQRLVNLQILDRVEKVVLGLFSYRRYPAHDRAVENEIRSRLRAALAGTGPANSRTLALLSLADACGLTKAFLDKKERQDWKTRIEELVGNEPVGNAVRAAIRDDDAAAAAVVIGAAATS